MNETTITSTTTNNLIKFPEHEHINCPRCDSTNTKFCYYNNYNLSQPRHFCKNCRRYWTKGGTLRNIPVGGATRKITKPKPKKQHVMTSSQSSTAPVQNNDPQVEMKVEHEHVHGHGHEEVFNGFGNLLMGVGPMGGFGSLLMDGGDVASEEVLIRNPNVGENGGGAGDDAEINGWPDLSIFTPGSSFR